MPFTGPVPQHSALATTGCVQPWQNSSHAPVNIQSVQSSLFHERRQGAQEAVDKYELTVEVPL